MEAPRKSFDEAEAVLFPGDPFERTVKRLCRISDRAQHPSTVTWHPSSPPLSPTSPFTAPQSPSGCTARTCSPPGTSGFSDVSATSALPAEPAPSLDDLGPDLLLHILRKAHPTAWDLCRMACVSRTWQQLCYSRVFWTKLRIGSGSIRPGVEALAARCGAVTELHVDDPRCELFILHPIVVACSGSLRRVVINCDRDSTSRNEASICSILWIISLHCKNVESIELISSGKQGGFEFIDNKALWYLTSGFRDLRSFACLCKDSMTKQSLYLMVIAWRDLTCLRVHCGQLSRGDLLCLRKCHALRVLELLGGNLGALLTDDRNDENDAQVGMAPPAHPQAAFADPGRGQSHADVIHADLEVLVLSGTATCPMHLAELLRGFPGLKRVLLNKESWAPASSTLQEVQLLRKQFGVLQRWLMAERQVDLLIEE